LERNEAISHHTALLIEEAETEADLLRLELRRGGRVKKLLLFACTTIYPLFANSPVQGQAEIAPDHYEATDSQSAPAKTAAKTKAVLIHYEGNFTLRYSVQCEGRSLRPGDYLVSLDSDGSTVRVTLNRRDQAVKFEGAAEKQPRYRGRDALLVERSGDNRQLSAIHIAQLELVLHPGRQGEQPKDRSLRNVEALPVTPGSSK
jgi:hypothetical protein